jgi:hypothetical protein
MMISETVVDPSLSSDPDPIPGAWFEVKLYVPLRNRSDPQSLL